MSTSPHLARRSFLTASAAASGLLVASGAATAAPADRRAIATLPAGELFTLGVASGDPDARSVVLWTRLAPDPLNGGGMPDADVEVEWQLADDEAFSRVVRRGRTVARAALGHSVHVEPPGLRPGREYWYRFRVADRISPVGRTKTAFAGRDRLSALSFAFVSCQNYEAGWFAAYDALAADDLDLVVHLGDYIYEGAARASGAVRPHLGPEPTDLVGYRNRHALYQLDPQLQAAQGAHPFVHVFDDHELDNNWADEIPQDPDRQTREAFLARRAAAFQVYYESLPLRRSSMPAGIDMQLYRRLTFGSLLEMSVLDTRQYRSDQPCGDGIGPRCPSALDEAATMTGPEQEAWLTDGLGASRARWNVVAQQVPFAQADWDAGPSEAYNLDAWDGYVAARSRLLRTVADAGVRNPVVLSGDTHSSWANDLLLDFADPQSPVVGTEFIGTSITSSYGASDRLEAALPESPWVKYFNGRQRGYTRCDVTPDEWRTTFRLLPISPEGAESPRQVLSPDVPLADDVTWVLPDRGTVQPG